MCISLTVKVIKGFLPDAHDIRRRDVIPLIKIG